VGCRHIAEHVPVRIGVNQSRSRIAAESLA
jgi:hypothetical protein